MHEELRRLDNHDLLERLHRIAAHERKTTAALVAHLAEVERRGLHREAGYGSMFEYCVIAAGRAAGRGGGGGESGAVPRCAAR